MYSHIGVLKVLSAKVLIILISLVLTVLRALSTITLITCSFPWRAFC
jgi:hypothetical protein